MFLVSYEESDGSVKNLASATSLNVAKRFIEHKMTERGASPIEEFEWQTDEEGRTIFLLGDTQYVIEALIHVS